MPEGMIWELESLCCFLGGKAHAPRNRRVHNLCFARFSLGLGGVGIGLKQTR